jgi:hypothetical protein
LIFRADALVEGKRLCFDNCCLNVELMEDCVFMIELIGDWGDTIAVLFTP